MTDTRHVTRTIRRTRRPALALAVLVSGVVTVVAACATPPAPPPTTGTVPPTTTLTTTTTTTTVPTGPAVLAENPVAGVPLGGTKAVTFFWNGQVPNQLIYVDICRTTTSDPTFQPGEDCAPLSSLNPTATPTGSGSTTVSIFRGPEPSTDLPWGCFRATDVAPPGVQRNTTCYVRVTSNTLFNNTAAREVAFTLA